MDDLPFQARGCSTWISLDLTWRVYVPFSQRHLVFFDESLLQVRSTGVGPACMTGRSPDILNSRSIVPADFSCSNAHSRSSSPIFPSVRLSRAANSSSSARRSRRIRRLSGAFHSPIKSNPRVGQLRDHLHLQFPPISDSRGTFASSWSVFLPRILRTLALRSPNGMAMLPPQLGFSL